MEIRKYKPQGHFVKALVYGPSGSGKTVFGATAPSPIFASAEGGLLSIAENQPAYTDIKSMKDLKELHKFLLTGGHEFETVVIDSISEINEIIKAEIEKRTGRSLERGDWADLSKQLRDLLRMFRDLPMHVLFIALDHTEKDEEKNTRFVPMLNGKSATEVAAVMDIVGYMEVASDGTRSIVTTTQRRYLTKDRSRLLTPDTPANFSAWVNLINTIETGDEELLAKTMNGTVVRSGGIQPDEQKEILRLWSEYWDLAMRAFPDKKTETGAVIYVEKNRVTVRDQYVRREFPGKEYLFQLTAKEGETMKSSLLDRADAIRQQLQEQEKAAGKAEEDAPTEA